MTLKCIAGIETPDEGRIVLNGRVLFDSEKKINIIPQKRLVGYMFQNYALFPHMTIEENIGAGIKKENKEKKKIVQMLIEKFELMGTEKHYPRELSGGEQQRAALARIMAYDPEVIMLDEPFSALDSFLKDLLQQELFDNLKNYNGDIILVSHNRDEIFKFCESLVVIDRGSVVTAGKTREIFKNPLTIASARLTGCKNISPIKHINDYELEACDWGIILKTEEKIESNITHVGIRGHNLQPSINKEQINTMKIELVQFTETAFEVQYLVKNAEVSEINNIWWMEKKKESDRDIKNNIADYLTFPSDKLILLKDK